jgi:hypothetical protein
VALVTYAFGQFLFQGLATEQDNIRDLGSELGLRFWLIQIIGFLSGYAVAFSHGTVLMVRFSCLWLLWGLWCRRST